MTLETDCSLVVTIRYSLSEFGDIRSSNPARSAHRRRESRIFSTALLSTLNPRMPLKYTSDNHHTTYSHSRTTPPPPTILSSRDTSPSTKHLVPLDRTSEPPTSVPGTYHNLKEALTSNRALLPLACFHKTRATRPPRRQRNSNDSTSNVHEHRVKALNIRRAIYH